MGARPSFPGLHEAHARPLRLHDGEEEADDVGCDRGARAGESKRPAITAGTANVISTRIDSATETAGKTTSRATMPHSAK